MLLEEVESVFVNLTARNFLGLETSTTTTVSIVNQLLPSVALFGVPARNIYSSERLQLR